MAAEAAGVEPAGAGRADRADVPAGPEVRDRRQPDQRLGPARHLRGAGGPDRLLLRRPAGDGRRRARARGVADRADAGRARRPGPGRGVAGAAARPTAPSAGGIGPDDGGGVARLGGVSWMRAGDAHSRHGAGALRSGPKVSACPPSRPLRSGSRPTGALGDVGDTHSPHGREATGKALP